MKQLEIKGGEMMGKSYQEGAGWNRKRILLGFFSFNKEAHAERPWCARNTLLNMWSYHPEAKQALSVSPREEFFAIHSDFTLGEIEKRC